MNRYINTTAHDGQLVHRLEMESSKFLTFSLSFPFCEMTTWSVYAFSVSELERERDCWTSSTVIRYFKEIRHNNRRRRSVSYSEYYKVAGALVSLSGRVIFAANNGMPFPNIQVDSYQLCMLNPNIFLLYQEF